MMSVMAGALVAELQFIDCCDVARAQCVALTDLDVLFPWFDRVLRWINRERAPAVVHDGAEVVLAKQLAVAGVLLEVVAVRRIDVAPVDVDEEIAIRAALLVPQTDGVPNLVDHVA